MKRFLFLGIAGVLAVSLAAFAGTHLLAGCRCNKASKSERKQVKYERKCARRGMSASPGFNTTTPFPGGNPYGVDGVQEVGAAANASVETEVVWQCQRDRKGRVTGCAPVRVPVAPQAKSGAAASPKPPMDPGSAQAPKPTDPPKVESDSAAKKTTEDAAARDTSTAGDKDTETGKGGNEQTAVNPWLPPVTDGQVIPPGETPPQETSDTPSLLAEQGSDTPLLE